MSRSTPSELPRGPHAVAHPPVRRAGSAGSASTGTALPPPVAGERCTVDHAGQQLALYLSMPQADAANRDLAPLVLVHSISAAASAAEVKPVFDAYAHKRPVVALELPGFGSSTRARVDYTPALMSGSLIAALDHLQQRGFRRPADVLALSLSCEMATLAALDAPTRLRSLALVSPTGLEQAPPEPYERGRTKDKAWLRTLLEAGPWAEPLFRGLTSDTSMRKFLQRAWGSEQIDEDLLAYNHLTVRAPGARHAPFAFIAGALFTRGVAHLYARLKHPVWMAHGTRGEFAAVPGLRTLGPPPHWTVDSFATGALPHFEAPDAFVRRYDRFLQQFSER